MSLCCLCTCRCDFWRRT